MNIESIPFSGIITIGLIVIGVIFALIFRGRCPKCKRYRVVKRTGAKRREGNRIFGTTFYEHRCKQCTHTYWAEDSNNGGDGGE